MNDWIPTEQFIREVTASQRRLYAFIFSLLLDPDAANEVLQETNLVIWRKAGAFAEGTSFVAWASQIARLEVLRHRRESSGDRHVFSDELVSQLAVGAEGLGDQLDDRTRALEACLQNLPSQHRQLVESRYQHGGTVKQAAQQAGTSPGAVAVTLHRVRNKLLDCIKRRLAVES